MGSWGAHSPWLRCSFNLDQEEKRGTKVEDRSNGPLIPGGYYKVARTLDYHAVYRKPPHYHRIWLHLIRNAHYEVDPTVKRSVTVTRGEVLTSVGKIQKETGWVENKRKVQIPPSTVRRA